MQDMMKQYGMGENEDFFAGEGETLVLNTRHPLVEFLRSKVVVKEKGADTESKASEHAEAVNAEKAADSVPTEAAAETKLSLTKQVCEQLYDLARIQHGSLGAERMAEFIQRSNTLLAALTERQ